MKWLLSLIVISLPLYIIRFKIFGFPTTFLEILILLTFAFWLVKSFREKRDFKKIFNTGFEKPIILFLLVAAISLLVTPDKRGGLGIFKAYVVEPILVFYMTVDTLQRTKSWRWLVWALIISGLWLSLFCFGQKITGRFTFAPWEMAQGRVSAVYNSANMVGLYLGPIIALILPLAFWRRSAFLGISAFLMVGATVFTRSKGTALALGGVFLFYFFYFVWRNLVRRQRIFLGFTLSLLFFLLVFLGFFFLKTHDLTPPVEGPVYQGSNTTLIRFYIWEGTLRMLFDHPFFGAGLNGFPQVYWSYHVREYWEMVQYPHNVFLTIWSELGVLGLLAFGWLIFNFLRKIQGLKGKNVAALKLGIMGALVYMFFHGLVDVPYFKNDLAVQFWLLLSLLGIKDYN